MNNEYYKDNEHIIKDSLAGLEEPEDDDTDTNFAIEDMSQFSKIFIDSLKVGLSISPRTWHLSATLSTRLSQKTTEPSIACRYSDET